MFGATPDPRSLSRTIELGEISRNKINKIGKPKLVNTYTQFLATNEEVIQESNTQMITIIPKDIFESNQDLKRFFDEKVAKTICNAQVQILTLKIIGQIGGLVKSACKGSSKNLYPRKIYIQGQNVNSLDAQSA